VKHIDELSDAVVCIKLHSLHNWAQRRSAGDILLHGSRYLDYQKLPTSALAVNCLNCTGRLYWSIAFMITVNCEALAALLTSGVCPLIWTICDMPVGAPEDACCQY
jgi:hypothetical protein